MPYLCAVVAVCYSCQHRGFLHGLESEEVSAVDFVEGVHRGVELCLFERLFERFEFLVDVIPHGLEVFIEGGFQGAVLFYPGMAVEGEFVVESEGSVLVYLWFEIDPEFDDADVCVLKQDTDTFVVVGGEGFDGVVFLFLG